MSGRGREAECGTCGGSGEQWCSRFGHDVAAAAITCSKCGSWGGREVGSHRVRPCPECEAREMREAKTTPGPWSYDRRLTDELHPVDGHVQHDGPYEIVAAEPHDPDDDGVIATLDERGDETEANARLIASAPELRDALRDGLALAGDLADVISAVCPYASSWDDEGGLVDRYNAFEATARALLARLEE